MIVPLEAHVHHVAGVEHVLSHRLALFSLPVVELQLVHDVGGEHLHEFRGVARHDVLPADDDALDEPAVGEHPSVAQFHSRQHLDEVLQHVPLVQHKGVGVVDERVPVVVHLQFGGRHRHLVKARRLRNQVDVPDVQPLPVSLRHVERRPPGFIPHHAGHHGVIPSLRHRTLEDGAPGGGFIAMGSVSGPHGGIRDGGGGARHDVAVAVQDVHVRAFECRVVKGIAHCSLDDDALRHPFQREQQGQ